MFFFFFTLFIHQRFLKKETQVIIFFFYIINQHIRMISEESCDTEDWSNDVQNSALITELHYILKYITTENHYFKL